MTKSLTLVLATGAALALSTATAFAVGSGKGQPNQADINHPDIHDKVGDGTNANPNGKTDDGGGLHGIGNVPGKNGDNPNADGTRGQANELETMHGGIGDVNKNAD